MQRKNRICTLTYTMVVSTFMFFTGKGVQTFGNDAFGYPNGQQGEVDFEIAAHTDGGDHHPVLGNPVVKNGRLHGTDKDEVLDAGEYGVMDVHGGYGDDTVIGTSKGDVLQGGHGEDRLIGGNGNDFLISLADGREPEIAQDYGSKDDPDKEINPRTRTYYPDQPIEADDVLIGGGGADTFHFRVLINAKRDIILKHVRKDGTINWGMNGVAGENDDVHDHWVETLGDEVIWDFNRAEGDHIEVVGHTVEVYQRIHEDSNGDGILDSTVLYIRSNQGAGGGAHNLDLLGTIRVFGDLVMESDYTVEKVNDGIVPTVDDLEEALSPRVFTSVANDGTPPPVPEIQVGELPKGAMMGLLEEVEFSGERGSHLDVAHDERFELAEGTIMFRFTADDVMERQALFSKDALGKGNGGHLTAVVEQGRVRVRMQDRTSVGEWVQSPERSVQAGKSYHVAVAFSSEGMWLYLNGEFSAWAPSFPPALTMNREGLVIGANGWERNESRPFATKHFFAGLISDFMIFGMKVDDHTVAVLAGGDPVDPNPTEPTVVDARLYGTDADEELHASEYSVMDVHGGYGDDVVVGTSEDDVLQGGHGEDRLMGGDGNDLLLSVADGREPMIAQDYGPEDDPNSEIDPRTRTYYSDQPIEADDVLVGGRGADTFHFRVVINAKRDIILKHIRRDGTINWGVNGVAGENDNVHDHWVERLGDEVVWDFSRAEGDHIEVVGHTVEVYQRVHEDSDGDGIPDSTVLYVRSNQGAGGGAHNLDELGTIRVFGDLVLESDYTVEKIDYGIVPTIEELDEAITPRVFTSVANDGTPPPVPEVDDGELPDDALFGVLNEIAFDGAEKDHLNIEHDEKFELAEGTITFRFTAKNVTERQALFSKDAMGKGDGGHLTAVVEQGRVNVRMQDRTSVGEWVRTPEGSVKAGESYHVAVTFGPEGMWLYLNGEFANWAPSFPPALTMNEEDLVIGANGWERTKTRPFATKHHFTGVISEFMIFGVLYDDDAVSVLAGKPVDAKPETPFVEDGLLYGTDDGELLEAGDHGVMDVYGGYGDDTIVGTSESDILQGGHGEDRLVGGDGDDFLISFADGREPVIAQDYGPEDDPNNEINPKTRTYYPDQPIEADDVLIGGRGADTFHFRVLINAKRDIILKHVRRNGTINWGGNGVAGENDNVHDHWVETLGDEVIWDFSRAEGDHIEVVGHTVEVYDKAHDDSDGDGILDSTVLYVRSNQGAGGGAHNLDQLGTIRVFGDLVMESDYTVKRHNYGIVPTIAELEEAITPRVFTSVADDGTPPPVPEVEDGTLPKGAFFGVLKEMSFRGAERDYLNVTHDERFELANGTIMFRFTAKNVSDRQALFSKDAMGKGSGGHLTAVVEQGRVRVRMQDRTSVGEWVQTPERSVQVGKSYHVAVTFGPDGMRLYLNGKFSDAAPSFPPALTMNREDLVIGANGWERTESRPFATKHHFSGLISKFMIFGMQVDEHTLAAHASR